jgi:hypothetical protein
MGEILFGDAEEKMKIVGGNYYLFKLKNFYEHST